MIADHHALVHVAFEANAAWAVRIEVIALESQNAENLEFARSLAVTFDKKYQQNGVLMDKPDMFAAAWDFRDLSVAINYMQLKGEPPLFSISYRRKEEP
jgi:hypothetical protein